jgi:hypothetical protein
LGGGRGRICAFNASPGRSTYCVRSQIADSPEQFWSVRPPNHNLLFNPHKTCNKIIYNAEAAVIKFHKLKVMLPWNNAWFAVSVLWMRKKNTWLSDCCYQSRKHTSKTLISSARLGPKFSKKRKLKIKIQTASSSFEIQTK